MSSRISHRRPPKAGHPPSPSGWQRRGAAALLLGAVLVAGLLAHPASGAPRSRAGQQRAASAADPGTTRPGKRVYLRASSTPATARVQARPSSLARANGVRTQFEVTYQGFTPEARAAFQRAVDLWSTLVVSSEVIRIEANFEDLGPGVLGGAMEGSAAQNFPGARERDTWYPAALANSMAHQDLDKAQPDIYAAFSSAADIDWYFGEDGRVPAEAYDFTTVVLHEIGHGLGFGGAQANVEGPYASLWTMDGHRYAYDRLVTDAGGSPLASLPNYSAALREAFVSDALTWSGADATAAAGGRPPKIYAPREFKPGSSIVHLDEAAFGPGHPSSLMTPKLDDGEAIHDPGDIGLGMLRDLGWATAGAPSTPAAPRLAPDRYLVGNGWAAVAWTPPVDTGRQTITGYRITRFDAGSATPAASYTVPAGATAHKIDGLVNGTAYRFSVAALTGAGAGTESSRSGVLQPADLAPFEDSEAFVRQQLRDFGPGTPTAEAREDREARLIAGTTPAMVIAEATELNDGTFPTYAMYQAYFQRTPDLAGFEYWRKRVLSTESTGKMSAAFAASSEFKRRYGTLTNSAFVKRVYQNVLGRGPDAAGLAHWTAKLDKKRLSRGGLVEHFAYSSEHIVRLNPSLRSVYLRHGMLRRLPTAAEVTADRAVIETGCGRPPWWWVGCSEPLAEQILASAEYRARFA
ncbi:MAG: hypothetical protein JWO77_63 [Ilumatobacteraceae bacterium]|nr:hypothetical protein [Ilumatobacteraceae bacterium]